MIILENPPQMWIGDYRVHEYTFDNHIVDPMSKILIRNVWCCLGLNGIL